MDDAEILAFLRQHLQAIHDNDLEAYHATTSEDLTLYEWWVTPHRIDGLPFHDFMMEANARRGSVFGAEAVLGGAVRFDLANLRIQRYGETAIASYTLLVSAETPAGVRVDAHNESRVMVKMRDGWKVVHVHKSPAWQAPHVPPMAEPKA
ncbi:MAG: nuclear transport factor 2 family protein [Anaerolineales bacterium]